MAVLALLDERLTPGVQPSSRRRRWWRDHRGCCIACQLPLPLSRRARGPRAPIFGCQHLQRSQTPRPTSCARTTSFSRPCQVAAGVFARRAFDLTRSTVSPRTPDPGRRLTPAFRARPPVRLSPRTTRPPPARPRAALSGLIGAKGRSRSSANTSADREWASRLGQERARHPDRRRAVHLTRPSPVAGRRNLQANLDLAGSSPRTATAPSPPRAGDGDRRHDSVGRTASTLASRRWTSIIAGIAGHAEP